MVGRGSMDGAHTFLPPLLCYGIVKIMDYQIFYTRNGPIFTKFSYEVFIENWVMS